ncbi:MAG: DUF2891 domain-containing protein [Alphaproteobacteria bacterium]
MHALTPELASKFARLALGHVTRAFPNKLDHVMAGPVDVRGPKKLHPIFYGSFDWHSCVHGYWLLARLVRRFPAVAEAKEISALFDAQITRDHVAGEITYLSRPESRGFERPYGWAWALLLQAELMRHDAPWAAALQPLADAFAERFMAFLPLSLYPVRAGTHFNTAFALLLAMEYARAARDERLLTLCTGKANAWYGADSDCQCWEPSQDDFLSPALSEAACMRAALAQAEFRKWFSRFLPRAAEGEPAVLFMPATVTDRSDGKIAHLDGLNLSRAWCWRLVLEALDAGDPLRPRAQDSISHHVESALPHVAGDYMGEHWLATFALLALDHSLH